MILPHKTTQKINEFRDWFFDCAENGGSRYNLAYFSPQSRIERHINLIHKAFNMANKKPRKKTTKFEFKGYANIPVPESHSSLIEKHIKDAQTVYEEINTLAVDGYSMKVYYSDSDGNYRASLTCMNPEDDNFGHVLASFAGDWYTAVAVLTYKHFYIAKENWNEYTHKATSSYG